MGNQIRQINGQNILKTYSLFFLYVSIGAAVAVFATGSSNKMELLANPLSWLLIATVTTLATVGYFVGVKFNML